MARPGPAGCGKTTLLRIIAGMETADRVVVNHGRVELLHGREIVEVEPTRERAESPGVANGQRVWLKPRQVKVFAPADYPLEEAGSGI